MNYLKFVHGEALSVEEINNLVRANNCGAVSMFLGTTRDNFEGKSVKLLEYEAYESMGLKVLEGICKEIRSQWQSVENIVIYHRLGPVPVKEISIIIAISSPHRQDAIKAVEFCINSVKSSVPVWKKEIYENGEEVGAAWKENKESSGFRTTKVSQLQFDLEANQVDVPFVAPHLIQIKCTNEEINMRISKFMDRKRSEININNIKEFCCDGDDLKQHDSNTIDDLDLSCARVRAKLKKRKNSKTHLQVARVLNTYHRDQLNSDYLIKYIPKNGVEERLQNLESQLSLHTPTSVNIYKRLKCLEDRLLLLESMSPEYIQLWEKCKFSKGKALKKRNFTIDEINDFIMDAKQKLSHA